MVWEQQTKVIVMATGLDENGIVSIEWGVVSNGVQHQA
jgi:hypothetical protein